MTSRVAAYRARIGSASIPDKIPAIQIQSNAAVHSLKCLKLAVCRALAEVFPYGSCDDVHGSFQFALAYDQRGRQGQHVPLGNFIAQAVGQALIQNLFRIFDVLFFGLPVFYQLHRREATDDPYISHSLIVFFQAFQPFYENMI